LVGVATFSAARYKIKSAFFQSLNALVVKHIETFKQKTWNGYQLIAVDGSTVSLPPSAKIKNHLAFLQKQIKASKPVWHKF